MPRIVSTPDGRVLHAINIGNLVNRPLGPKWKMPPPKNFVPQGSGVIRPPIQGCRKL